MVFSQAYSEMQQQATSRCQTDGQRSYPSPCLEIFLLNQAQRKAEQKEAALFRQLISIFDWELTAKQQKTYLKALGKGATLVLTDPSKTILWTSHSFLRMTGYTPREAIGQTPAFLQGVQTNRTDLRRVSEQLRRAAPARADLINYRKSGEVYVCRVAIDPLRNSQGELTHFLAVESEV